MILMILRELCVWSVNVASRFGPLLVHHNMSEFSPLLEISVVTNFSKDHSKICKVWIYQSIF